MTISDFGNLGEFIGAIGVVITLVYLALQTKLNTKSVKNNTVQELLSKSADLYMDASKDNEMIVIRQKVRASIELSETEKAKLEFQNLGILSNLQNEYYQYCHDNIEQDMHDAYRCRLHGFISNSGGFCAFWKSSKSNFSLSFQEYVESIIDTIPEITI